MISPLCALNELLRKLSLIRLEINKWFGDRRVKGVFLLDFSYSVIYEHHKRMSSDSTFSVEIKTFLKNTAPLIPFSIWCSVHSTFERKITKGFCEPTRECRSE